MAKLKKPDSFFSGLLGIADRVAKERQRKDQLRRQKEIVRSFGEEAPGAELSQDYALETAIAELPEAYRQVILLRYYGQHDRRAAEYAVGHGDKDTFTGLCHAARIAESAGADRTSRGEKMNCTECKELLVAHIEGLLEETQQQAVAEHMKDCNACKAEAETLRGLRDRLTGNGKTLAQGDLENNVMNLIVREQKIRLKAAEKAAEGLKLRRIIMKSRFAKIAAAAAVIIAVLIGLNPLSSSVSFADVVEPILNAKTVIFDLIIGGDESGTAMHEIVVGPRIRRTISNMSNLTQILDPDSGTMLVLDNDTQTAMYVDIQGTVAHRTKNYVASIREIIERLQNDQDSVEKLGEQVIDGQEAIGFAASNLNEEITIWADPETALPIRIELRIGQEGTAILKNFEFDVDADDALVSMDIPAGYTEQKTDFNISEATEEDFVESLRIWAEIVRDGTFPDAVGSENTMKAMPLLVQKLTQMQLSEQEGTELGMGFARRMLFHQIVDGQGNWHYAGAGVKLGDAATAIFWYQPSGSDTYRVIYGDLSVKDIAEKDLPK